LLHNLTAPLLCTYCANDFCMTSTTVALSLILLFESIFLESVVFIALFMVLYIDINNGEVLGCK